MVWTHSCYNDAFLVLTDYVCSIATTDSAIIESPVPSPEPLIYDVLIAPQLAVLESRITIDFTVMNLVDGDKVT